MSDIRAQLEAALAMHREGRISEAEQVYRQILALNPNDPNALHLLGLVAYQMGQPQPAVDLIGRAISFDPSQAVYYNTYGAALQRLGHYNEAENAFRNALRYRPNFDEAYYNLANVMLDLGRRSEAEICYRKAIEIRPNYAEAYGNLGNCYIQRGQSADAIVAYRKAIELKPNFPEALNNLANVYQGEGQLDEAVVYYRQALAVNPSYLQAAENLSTALWHMGRLNESLALLQQIMNVAQGSPVPSSRFLLASNYNPQAKPDELASFHHQWGAELERVTPLLPTPTNDRDPDRVLRVAYLSGDFRSHAVVSFLEPILRHHDPARVSVFAYNDVLVPDDTTTRLKKLVPNWRDVSGQPDPRVAQRMRDDRIDILVDLSGHTSLGRLLLFAMKPAPVAVSYLGYANTTGLKRIDYFLTDSVCDPPGVEPRYSETLFRIDPNFSCYQPPSDAPDVSELPALKNGHVTFASLHGTAKLNDRVLDAWGQIMAALPSARLICYRHNLLGSVAERLKAELSARGLTSDRFEIHGQLPPGESRWNVYQRADLSLDVFPWSGHTTACESLWMGVPLVTLLGPGRPGRMVASVLNALGRPQWIAESEADYVARVVSLASDLSRLQVERAELRQLMSQSLQCDGAGFTARLEAAYRQMWHTWCSTPAAPVGNAG